MHVLVSKSIIPNSSYELSKFTVDIYSPLQEGKQVLNAYNLEFYLFIINF